MLATALQTDSAWAEDRALLRSNPSAVPGPRPMGRHEATLSFTPLIGIGIKAINLRSRMPRLPWQDALHHLLIPIGQHSSSR